MKPHTTDQKARDQALNPQHSFIVQAPAGSGKTELLTQRYLTLLAQVSHPEEIIAVTFTRKAQGEMKERILEALKLASHPKPMETHKQKTWALAQNALKKNEEKLWKITQNTHRLRILTMDALSAFLCQRMPLSAKINPKLQIYEKPAYLYQEAIESLYRHAPVNPPLKKALKICLLQVDNRADYLTRLLIELLQKRDQWLSHLIPLRQDLETTRIHLENALKQLAQKHLDELNRCLDLTSKQLLFRCLQLAASHLEDQPDSFIYQQGKQMSFPLENKLNQLSSWQAIAELLLTQDNQWRKALNKRQGFPPQEKNKKIELQQFIHRQLDNETLRRSLIQIRLCPPLRYEDKQWEVLQALITLIPHLMAELHWIFQQTGQMDFIEINLAAIRALGEEENPTDLALHLDHRISHLLIDEFQDTSQTQFQLIEKLLWGWTPEEGRTVFLVGDPMQSIYRFRQAEVSLFLKAKTQGIGSIQPQFLELSSNFRSCPQLVEWYNSVFSNSFPKVSDPEKGAIHYHPSESKRIQEQPLSVHFHPLFGQEEASLVLDLIQQINLEKETLAILVRSRAQLLNIIPALARANLPYQAVDIAPLLTQTAVLDAMTLTRALLHLADRTAWLALLRTPAIGLTLTDLLALSQHAEERPLWQSLMELSDIHLSRDGKIRCHFLVSILQHAFATRAHQPLHLWVHKTWKALRFDKTVIHPSEQLAISHYFDCLQKLSETHEYLNTQILEEALREEYLPTAKHEAQIQLMTIHKSKGLEFDHVILPNIDRSPPPESQRLLLWLEGGFSSEKRDLLLAPMRSPDDKADSIYRYCQLAEQEKLEHEQVRLFYVAATRARHSLHLIAQIEKEEDNSLKKAPRGSFLAHLETHFYKHFPPVSETLPHTPPLPKSTTPRQGLTRLTISEFNLPTHVLSTFPESPSPCVLRELEAASLEQIHEKSLLGQTLHHELYLIAQLGLSHYQINPKRILVRLKQAGAASHSLNTLMEEITQTLKNVLNSPKGQWILSPHPEAQSEYAVCYDQQGEWKTAILDRCFVEQETLWIIDYKSSLPHPQETTETFLARQKIQHLDQLTQYAVLMSEETAYPIYCGLYFPRADLWCEWPFIRRETSCPSTCPIS